jgi:hypothetical protein
MKRPFKWGGRGDDVCGRGRGRGDRVPCVCGGGGSTCLRTLFASYLCCHRREIVLLAVTCQLVHACAFTCLSECVCVKREF